MANEDKKPREVVATIKLSRPVKAFGEEVQVLEFRRATLGDLKVFDGKGPVEGLIALISRLAAIPLSAAEAIDPLDVESINEVLADFLPGGLGIGRPGPSS